MRWTHHCESISTSFFYKWRPSITCSNAACIDEIEKPSIACSYATGIDEREGLPSLAHMLQVSMKEKAFHHLLICYRYRWRRRPSITSSNATGIVEREGLPSLAQTLHVSLKEKAFHHLRKCYMYRWKRRPSITCPNSTVSMKKKESCPNGCKNSRVIQKFRWTIIINSVTVALSDERAIITIWKILIIIIIIIRITIVSNKTWCPVLHRMLVTRSPQNTTAGNYGPLLSQEYVV